MISRRCLLAAAFASLPGVALASSRDLSLDLHGCKARVTYDGDTAWSDLIAAWVRKSADAVFAFYGRFPVPTLRIILPPMLGDSVGAGKTFTGDTPQIRIAVGTKTRPQTLLTGDWVMVHEMVHLAFPWMNGRHNWMAEGIAVYVEPIARAQARHISAEQAWGDFMRDMPRGLPKAGDKGLDNTITWGRTYWGGALFCLEADIAIRQKTKNAKGLRDALRAINQTRDFRKSWDFNETLGIGDKATGATVLRDLYAANRNQAVKTDLPALWKSLGLIADPSGDARFDDTAPLAAIRQAITQA